MDGCMGGSGDKGGLGERVHGKTKLSAVTVVANTQHTRTV